MEASMDMGMGFMAVFAVSGSVVLIANQLHKRLLSRFLKKIECEIHGSEKCEGKRKRVRFADDVVEPSGNSKEYRNKRNLTKLTEEEDDKDDDDEDDQLFVKMPVNRQILYKGMIQYRTLQSQNCF